MYEHRSAPLLSHQLYLRRLARGTTQATAIVVLSLGLGTLGFWALAEQAPIDALLNAAMLLGGMGPVDTDFHGPLGTLFAGVYALFAGLVFLAAGAVFLAPMLHRWLHRLHLEESGGR